MKKPSENLDFGLVYTGGDGSSLEKAVVIDVSPFKGEASPGIVGVKLEHIWIDAQFPGAKPLEQRLSVTECRICDVITIRLPSGEERSIYFDIGNFFPRERPVPSSPVLSSSRLLGWFGWTAGVVAVVGLVAWWTRDTRMTEVNPGWIVFFGGLVSLILWLRALPAMTRSPLGGGRLHLVLAAGIVLSFAEWLLIWHFFPGFRVHLDNFSNSDVELLLNNKAWSTLSRNSSKRATISRGSWTVTVREAVTGKTLDEVPIGSYDSGPYILNVLGAQAYYQGSVTYGEPWPPPTKREPHETTTRERWISARVNYLFEHPPRSIELNTPKDAPPRSVTRTYLLREPLKMP